jgi:hypothetical protein
MVEGDTRSTLHIAREFLKASERYEGITFQATLLRHPYWWLLSKFGKGVRQRRQAELSEKQIALLGELVDRYDGILFQLFTWTGIQVGFDEFDKKAGKIWYKFQVEARDMPSYRDFSTTLWKVYLRYGNEIAELKPKFVLRQFVDEMLKGEGQAVLRAQAYPRQVALSTVDREVARMIYRSYPVLHARVVNLKSHLLRLTGGVLNREEIDTLEHTYMKYHDWLFPKR